MLKLFHISDCHIDKEIIPEPQKFIEGLNGHNIEVWGAFQKHFQERTKDLKDYTVIITGDISAQGSIDSLQLAKNFLVKDDTSEISKKLGLNIPEKNLFIIPGNHDSFNDRLLGRNSLKNYKEIFGVNDFFPITNTFNHNGGTVALIGFDSTYLRKSASIVKKLGRGVIEKNQYRIAEGFLREKKFDFKLVCLHHNPIFPP